MKLQANPIATKRLELIAATSVMVRSEINGDAGLSRLLNARIATGWPTEYWDKPPMEWTLNALESGGFANGWGMWYWVLRPPHVSQRTLIGNGGFKGKPDAQGTVEIGYAIVPEHRRCGYATEACIALIEWAFAHSEINRVTAETYPQLLPSIGVMDKLGMIYLGKGSEAETIRYGLTRERYESAPAQPARSTPPVR